MLTMKKTAGNLAEHLANLQSSQLENLHFFRDGLREGIHLELPVKDPHDIDEFINALRILRPSTVTLRNLRNPVKSTVKFRLADGIESREISIAIYESPDLGGVAVLSLAVEGSIFSSYGGQVESTGILAWVKRMKTKKGFENISVGE